MEVLRDLESLRRSVATERDIAFVPTMGNLHEGHLSLARIARSRASCVAVSIFVNRLQFAPNEDYATYPRTFDADCAKLAAEGVSLVFAPEEAVLYPEPQAFQVEPPGIANELEGKFRPRFFHGVATAVLKLFNCVQPRFAVFGKKDYQQLMIVRAMVRQFNLPIEIVAGDTVREPDGLAMSSRNGYLSATERAEAPRLYRTLCELKARLEGGDRAAGALGAAAVSSLSSAGWRPDYVEVRRRGDLAPADQQDRELVVLAAARLGTTRLIDNVEATL
jgi:pantoate--beta-alanine ligase